MSSSEEDATDDEFGVQLEWPNGTPARRRRSLRPDADFDHLPVPESQSVQPQQFAPADTTSPLLPALARSIDAMQLTVQSLATRISSQAASTSEAQERSGERLSARIDALQVTLSALAARPQVDEAPIEDVVAALEQLGQRMDSRFAVEAGSGERVLSALKAGVDAVTLDIGVLRDELEQVREEFARLKRRLPIRANRAHPDAEQAALIAAEVRDHLRGDDLVDRIAEAVIDRLLEAVEIVETDDETSSSPPRRRPLAAPSHD